MDNMCLVSSELDYNRFGVKTAKVAVSEFTDIGELHAQVLANDFKFIIARCPSELIDKVQELEGIGFFLTDTLVYYKKSDLLGDVVNSRLDSEFAVRYADKSDSAALEKKAAIIFADYFGHYHADSRLDKQDCDAVYVSWAANSCLGLPLADQVILIEERATRNIVAFSTVKIEADNSCQMLLVGVDPGHQKKGLLGALVAECIAWAKDRKISSIVYSTQVTNINAQNGVIKQGFKFFKSYYTFHKWVSE